MESWTIRQLVLMVLGVVLLSALWVTRYEVVTAGGGIAAYRLDRWTGNVQYMRGSFTRKVGSPVKD